MRSALLALPAAVSGHANSLYPPAWWDAGGKHGLVNSAGTPWFPTWPDTRGREKTPHTVPLDGSCHAGCYDGKNETGTCYPACYWFSDGGLSPTDERGVCLPKGAEEIAPDSRLRTYRDQQLKRTPWLHPGLTKAYGGGCGVGGGNPAYNSLGGCPGGPPCQDGAGDKGPEARYFKGFIDVVTTNWKVGQVVEAAWQIGANHGGGYAYRLCPETYNSTGHMQIDEECFNRGHLDFVGDYQWFQFGYNRSSRALFGDIPAVHTSKLVYPEGKPWKMNPIPACKGRGGAGQSAFPNKGGAGSCTRGTRGPQFEPVGGFPGTCAKYGIYTYGFGNNEGSNTGGPFVFSIIDLLQVPKDIKPGKYILSMRYDGEQFPQVWNSCASINILPADSTEPDGALTPDGPAGIPLPPEKCI